MLNLNWLYKQVKYLTCKIRNTVSLDDTGKIDPSLLPASSGTTWGSITGTLTSQTDLNTALSEKLTGTQGVAVSNTLDESDTAVKLNALLASLRDGGIIKI